MKRLIPDEQLVAVNLPSQANVECLGQEAKYYANVLEEINSIAGFNTMTEEDISGMKENIHLIVNAVQMSYKKMASIYPIEAKIAGLA